MSNNLNKKQAGYKNLNTYILATIIYDLTVLFCRNFIASHRQKEQMVQVARSGKANIAEGYTFESLATYIQLLGVAKGSLKELCDDYEDFLRQRNLLVWPKDHPQIRAFRAFRARRLKPSTPNTQEAANMLLTFCQMATYLLARQIESLNDKFVREGGFREKLLQRRLAYRKKAKYG